jgi:hypothetical protein
MAARAYNLVGYVKKLQRNLIMEGMVLKWSFVKYVLFSMEDSRATQPQDIGPTRK